MSGLSDEAGASAPLAMAVKQVGAPSQFEVDRLEEFIEETVWQARLGEETQPAAQLCELCCPL